jgi:hypothetical protein
MKNEKDKKENMPGLQNLTGSPASDAVSKVAMGEQPETAREESNEYTEDVEAKFRGEDKTVKACDCEDDDECEHEEVSAEDIKLAYAQIFEGLSILSKS